MRRRYQREAFLLLAVFGIAVAIVLYFELKEKMGW